MSNKIYNSKFFPRKGSMTIFNKISMGSRSFRVGRYLILVVLLCIGSILAQRASAQLESQTVTITPPTIKLSLNPGDKTEGTLGLINESNGDLKFLIGVYDFVVTDNKGTPEILPRGTISTNRYSAANWVAASPDGFTVKAHQRFNVNYFIQVPKNAGPGGHYAAIVYQPVAPNEGPNTGARIQTQIATLVYLTVNGPVSEFAKVTQFTAPSFQEYGPVSMTTEIKNFGDVHISPHASITVKDIFGRTIATIGLKDRNIFPGNISLIYNNLVGNNTFLIGKFTATLLGSYGANNNLPLTAELSFWVFPWKAALLLILLIIILILAVLLWRKKKKEHKQAKTTAATAGPAAANSNPPQQSPSK